VAIYLTATMVTGGVVQGEETCKKEFLRLWTGMKREPARHGVKAGETEEKNWRGATSYTLVRSCASRGKSLMLRDRELRR